MYIEHSEPTKPNAAEVLSLEDLQKKGAKGDGGHERATRAIMGHIGN